MKRIIKSFLAWVRNTADVGIEFLDDIDSESSYERLYVHFRDKSERLEDDIEKLHNEIIDMKVQHSRKCMELVRDQH